MFPGILYAFKCNPAVSLLHQDQHMLMKKNKDNMRNAFPVIKYDYQGKLISSNGTALPLLGQWNCRQGKNIPASIMKTYPELSFAMTDHAPVECCIAMGDCNIWFDIVPYPEAGYIGMYGHSVEVTETVKETPNLRMAG
jgi:hypothetical protein